MIKKDFLKHMFFGALLTGAFLLGTDISAWAQDDSGSSAATFGDIVCNAVHNSGKPFAELFSYIAYTAGVLFVLQGIMQLKTHLESPQNAKISTGLMFMAGGSALLAFPSVLASVVMSLYTSPTAGDGTLACTAGNAGGSTTGGLDGMLVNFVGNIQAPLYMLCSTVAILCGIFMVMHGLMKASKYGMDPKTNSPHKIVTELVFGGLLIAIGDNLSMMMNSVFGTTSAGAVNAGTVTSWQFVSTLGGSAQFATAVAAALNFIQIIGVIAFVRGWLVMKKVVEGGGNVTMAQGITHIVGGVLAINIGVFLQIMDKTFGTNLLGGS